jgi:hypothetical protein
MVDISRLCFKDCSSDLCSFSCLLNSDDLIQFHDFIYHPIRALLFTISLLSVLQQPLSPIICWVCRIFQHFPLKPFLVLPWYHVLTIFPSLMV